MSKISTFFNLTWQYYLRFQQQINSIVLFGLVVILGAGLRIYDLGSESYWVDEYYTILEGQQTIPQMLSSGRLDQPPGFYMLFHYWEKTFGISEVSTRTFSVIAGITTIVLIYLVGRELFGKQIGLIASLLMAVSAFQIYYSQTTRFYILFELAALTSFLFFILALRRKKKIFFVFYAAASIFLIYSLIFGLWIIAAQNLFIFLQIKKHRKLIIAWIITQVVILLAMVPYFAPLVFGANGMGAAVDLNIGSIPMPGVMDPLRSIVHFILLARGDRSWGVMLTNYGIAVLVFVVGTLIYASWQRKQNWISAARGLPSIFLEGTDTKSNILLLFCWFLCPILLLFIFSLLIRPMYKDYYTISAAPAFYLLSGYVIYNLRKVVPMIISLIVLGVLILPGLGYYYGTDINQQWKQAAAYIDKNSTQNEVIVFAGGVGTGIEQKLYRYYDRSALPQCTISNDLTDPAMKSEALMKCISGHDHFWVLIRDSTEPSTLSETYHAFFSDSKKTNIHLVQSHQFIDISVFNFEIIK